MRRLLVLLLVATFAIADDKPPTTAQALDLARLWLDGQRAYEEIPGISAAIVSDQKILWSGGSGHAEPGTARVATADTLYSICSVSKLFTSVAVMQLRDEGKLTLDDPIAKHLPWFTMKAANGGRDATILGTLTHSSGLPRESDYPYWTGEFDFPTREKIIERVAAQEALYPSDRYFQYSNLGLTLAGEVVSARAGKPYADVIRERILAPLHLDATYPEMPLEEKGKRLAQGFSARRRDGTRAALPLFQTRGIAPAAGFASSVNDLAKFAMWQFRARDAKSDAILDPRTLREMYRPHFVDPNFETFWGIGFATWKAGDTVFVGHGGSCPGYRTDFALDPEKKVGVVVMANASGVNTGRYAKALYDIVTPALKNSETDPAAAALALYAGSYDAFPWDGETVVVVWGDGLATIDLPTTEPMKSLERLRKTGDHTFRRVRSDGTLGETYRFELGPDGKPSKVWVHSNPYPRMK
ncbi:MAG TPA: serine hydrolase domain-containing protein [Thermoanaerobaculia bacterium]|jgi:CubicO group peptidase (beta-lactamase class C family)|nr:serine hydrolase domain-containing protein [Thermoanaerobaculia bacterium]